MATKINTTRDGKPVEKTAVETFSFPGGEKHLRLPGDETPASITITNDGHTMDDLAVAGLYVDWCRSQDVPAIINMPYLPAARADRGTPFGAKVYANIINALGADHVRIFDPHSSVMPEMVNNVEVINFIRVARRAVFGGFPYGSNIAGIIAPDAGAVKRASLISESTRLPLYTAEKVRDFATGKLQSYDASSMHDIDRSKTYLVVDDICDGGGTFRLLAGALNIPKENLWLWVSHGIFSGNAAQLSEHYGRIFTTNSVVSRSDIEVSTTDLTYYLSDTYADQLNERNH